MATQTLERDRVEEAVVALLDEFRGVYSTETIRRCADDTAQQFEQSRVLDFVPLFIYRFTRERLSARGQVEGLIVKVMPEVLFVCTHNAGRSQMAAVLTAALSGDRVHVRSAGTTPADEINPVVVQAMEEIGLDLSQEFPKPLNDDVVQAADVVVTMGCGDACEVYPGKRYLDWELGDPAGQPLAVVREIRDEIRRRVESLLRELDIQPVAIG
jgi:arsenate reductase (thioredoxin)